jgi:acetyltransferase-like isoleucine patch superfamily enzyme
VLIGHAVTIASAADEESRVVIHDDVFLGTGCLLVSGQVGWCRFGHGSDLESAV